MEFIDLLQQTLAGGDIIQICLMIALIVFQTVYSKKSGRNDEEIIQRLTNLEATDEQTLDRVNSLEETVKKLEETTHKLEIVTENIIERVGIYHDQSKQ